MHSTRTCTPLRLQCDAVTPGCQRCKNSSGRCVECQATFLLTPNATCSPCFYDEDCLACSNIQERSCEWLWLMHCDARGGGG